MRADEPQISQITQITQIWVGADPSRIGTYVVVYTVSDPFGNTTSAVRTVRVFPSGGSGALFGGGSGCGAGGSAGGLLPLGLLLALLALRRYRMGA